MLDSASEQVHRAVMFDPDSVHRDMAQLFAHSVGDADGERQPRPSYAIPDRRRPRAVRQRPAGVARKGMLWAGAFLLATIVIPLLVIIGTWAATGRRTPAGRIDNASTAVTTSTAARERSAAPVPPTPQPAASAYAVVANEAAEAAGGSSARRTKARRRSPAQRWARSPRLAGAALERALADDALITQRLNEAAIDKLHPTLGYSQTVMDQTMPR